VNAVGFPEIFAGVKSEEKPSAIQSIPPRIKLPPLQDYQIAMKDEMLKILKLNGNKTQSMVTLPTGGGKTRIAVQAFVARILPG